MFCFSKSSRRGYFECVDLLIKAGAKVNADPQNSDVDPPLHMAAQGGCDKCINMLIQNGADVNYKGYIQPSCRSRC